ncbi:hypothetical protein O9G_004213 [Rozella allomycis CSF55]|uniref:Uncharacterized protein n=1 Tax=Rozella allomycis (strain CSF55) TaxID=988480 RepID=A0A075AY62_ROZAC|nr:hypothetical protein O9G_004213 [Rozella allomycis CSF55]|eukprot:EPZ35202.1 hypothetical protein O9G_004213 [Rozella allomycis CSF55]
MKQTSPPMYLFHHTVDFRIMTTIQLNIFRRAWKMLKTTWKMVIISKTLPNLRMKKNTIMHEDCVILTPKHFTGTF